LPPHDRKHGLGHCDCAEKVGFELQAQFFHLDVLDEAADGEAGIVDEHIDASVFVDHGIYKRGHGIEVRHIEGANVDPVRDLGGGCRLIERFAPGYVAHCSDNAESRLGHFHRRQQAKAARCSGQNNYLFSHGSWCITGRKRLESVLLKWDNNARPFVATAAAGSKEVSCWRHGTGSTTITIFIFIPSILPSPFWERSFCSEC